MGNLEVVMYDWQVKNEENDGMRKFYKIDLAQTARKYFSAVSVAKRSALQHEKNNPKFGSLGAPQRAPK